MPTLPYPLHPEPLRRSWIERHPGWKIPLGCLILLVLVGGFVTIALTGVMASLHGSDIFNQAMSRATADPQVRAQLGEPLRPGWFIAGQMNVNGSTGNADLSIPISGPRGKGEIRAVAVKIEGVWRFTRLHVKLEGVSEPLDLLSVQPPAERQF